MNANAMLAPVMVLIAWSLCILVLLYLRRVPAMRKAQIRPDDYLHEDVSDRLPLSERQTAANYNHLMEQPTIFYALCLTIAVLHHVDTFAVVLAWSYVGLRVVHSLIQVTYHKVMHRFSIFILSSMVLMAMTIWELLNLFA